MFSFSMDEIRERGRGIGGWIKDKLLEHKCLIIWIIIMFLFGYLIGSVVHNHAKSENEIILDAQNTTQPCLTQICVQSASEILDRADFSVHPCSDFYDFACGNFIKSTSIPDYQSKVDSFTLIEDINDNKLRAELVKPISENDIQPVFVAKQLYQGCMNSTDIENKSIPMLKSILSSFGGMPLLNSKWNDKMFPWPKPIYELVKHGVNFNFFFIVSIVSEHNDPRDIAVDLSQPRTGPFEKAIKKGRGDPIVEAYYTFVVRTMIALGAEKEQAELDAQEIVNFEVKLTQLAKPLEVRLNESTFFLTTTIHQLNHNFSYVDWLAYINLVIAPHRILEGHHPVSMYSPTYFHKLGLLLDETNERILGNYIGWRVIRDNAEFLTEEIRDYEFQFRKAYSGVTARVPRYKECVDVTSRKLDLAIGEILVRYVYKKASWAPATEIAVNIKKQLIESLKTAKWLDEKTRKIALDKAESVAFILGSEDKLDDLAVIRYYDGLILDPKNYFGSILNITKFDARKYISGSRHIITNEDDVLRTYAPDVETFYDWTNNSIVIPAGILHGVFYRNGRPQYLNYGAIGTLIGHEIIHGFDQIGRMQDKRGNLVEWWDPYTRIAFDKQTLCFVEQYRNITVPEINIKINGANTEEENIGDNTGVKFAFAAYQKYIEEHGAEQPLPGLPFTPRQLFWISYAHQWCTIQTKKLLRTEVEDEDHTPSRYRVNVPLMNNYDFAKDFRCKKGSPMNPELKCKIF